MSTITTLNDGITANSFRTQLNTNFANLNTDKAEDSAVVHDTGNETIAGVKTFTSSPIVPTPTTATQAVNKEYADYTQDFYKYSIVPSVASGNLTVALKNYEGNDPTPSKPVKIQIGGVIRTITSALGLSSGYGLAGISWYNAGSSELATKEIDYFVYLRASSDNSIRLFHSRIPNATVMSDFSASGTYTNEKYGMDSGGIPATTDPVVNIGRFNAILGAGNAWSIGTSIIINNPILQTRYLDYTPVGTGYTAGGAKYRIDGNNVNLIIDSTANITGNITAPFTCTNTVDNQMITSAGTAVLPKNSNTITVATNPQNISGFFGI